MGLAVTVGLAVAVGLVVAVAPAAGAHTQLQRATPGPAEEVAGTVDEVRLDFLDPLMEAPEIVVTGPGGDVVPGLEAAELVADDVAVARFDPLRDPGRYTVSYDFASVDGAPQQGAHQFTFTGTGTGTGTGDEDGGAELRPALAVLVGLVVAVLAVGSLVLRSVRGR